MRQKLLMGGMAALIILSLAVIGCKKNYSSNPVTPTGVTATTTTVQMMGTSFSPATITVPVGTTITWKNASNMPHTSTSDNGVWDTGNIAAGASATTKFSTAGTFPYHCTYHVALGMVGTVVVK